MTPREHKVSKSIRVNECFRVIEVVVSTSLPLRTPKPTYQISTRSLTPLSSQNNKNLRPGELDEHMAPGGQTMAGEMPRGANTEDGVESRRCSRNEGVRKERLESEEHPWFPRTSRYQEEGTWR
jgi:hypothetical protein